MIQEVAFRHNAEINFTNKVWFCFVRGFLLVGCCFCCFSFGLVVFCGFFWGSSGV